MSAISLRSISPSVQLSFLCGTIYFYVGVFAPFFPLWLQARGLSAGEIAMVLAAPLVARVIANPVLLSRANRNNSVGETIVFGSLATLAGYVALAFCSGFWPILIVTGAIFFFQGPLMPLSDVLILNHVSDDPDLHYGSIRSWGSILVLVGMVMSGLLAGHMPPEAIIWLLILAAAIQAVTAVAMLSNERPKARTARAPVPTEKIEKFGLLIMVIVAASLVQASHAMLSTFGSIYWHELGHSDLFIGLAWAIGVFTEIIMFMVAGRYFGGENNATVFFVIGSVSAMVRWSLMAFDMGGAGIMATQAMHGLSFCATHLGTVFLISKLTPAGRLAQVQGWYVGTNALFTAAVTTLSGPIYARYGGECMVSMVLPAFIGLVIILGVARIRRRERFFFEKLAERASAP